MALLTIVAPRWCERAGCDKSQETRIWVSILRQVREMPS